MNDDEFKKRVALSLEWIAHFLAFFAGPTLGTLLFLSCSHADEIDDLLPHIIQVESSGNPNAISKDGCRGVAQFSKVAWQEVMKEPYLPNVYNSELSKIACERYLRLLKKRLGDNYTPERLCASYNMGLSRLRRLNYKWWKIKETKNYVKKIKLRMSELR